MLLLTPCTSCTRMDLAKKYFEQAIGWVPDDGGLLEGNLQHSRPFDYKSIMIYGPKIGRARGVEGYPIVTADGDLIHMGGDADPEKAGISDLDIERVVELYPVPTKDSHSTPGESPSTLEGAEMIPPGWHSKPAGPPEKSVSKRWYSVQGHHDPQSNTPQPWPVSPDGSHTITYCFETDDVSTNLGATWTRAMLKWRVAIEASSLQILPDPVCDQLGQVPCICRTRGIADETVHIGQTAPNQPMYGAMSSIGWLGPNVPRRPDRPRHGILWPPNNNWLPSPSHAGLAMAHELGERTRPKSSKTAAEANLSQDMSSGSHTNTNAPTQAPAYGLTAALCMVMRKQRGASKTSAPPRSHSLDNPCPSMKRCAWC
jgi:hypothetical protein